MKSGTTALYDALRRHPQIFMSRNKEPLFLARELSEHDVLRRRKQERTPETSRITCGCSDAPNLGTDSASAPPPNEEQAEPARERAEFSLG